MSSSQSNIKLFFRSSSSSSTTTTNSITETGGESPRKRVRIATEVVLSSTTSDVGSSEIAMSASSSSSSSNSSSGTGDWEWDMDEQWKGRLAGEFNKAYFRNLTTFVASEYSKKTVFPPANQVFNALNCAHFDDIKVVIVGQDPYHGDGQAHGLSFSVQKGVAIPPSLRNIFKELMTDPAQRIKQPSHGNLECWARQGVLLLNTCLTVRKGEANSHSQKGWEQFTDAIVKQLSTRTGLVYLLWGLPAQVDKLIRNPMLTYPNLTLTRFLTLSSQTKCKGIDGNKNTIIKTSHPSPLSATKTDAPFIGSRCFTRCNDALSANGKTPIDWNCVA